MQLYLERIRLGEKMLSPQKITQQLFKDDLFEQWQREHPKNFLSHLFAALDSEFKFKSSWEIGYFAEDKITVFLPLKKGFEIKPADEIFRQKTTQLEPLELKSVVLSYEDALNKFQDNQLLYFPKVVLGDGFVILQTINSKVLWNFSFITRQLKFINVKINAFSGKEEDHQEIDLVQKS